MFAPGIVRFDDAFIQSVANCWHLIFLLCLQNTADIISCIFEVTILVRERQVFVFVDTLLSRTFRATNNWSWLFNGSITLRGAVCIYVVHNWTVMFECDNCSNCSAIALNRGWKVNVAKPTPMKWPWYACWPHVNIIFDTISFEWIEHKMVAGILIAHYTHENAVCTRYNE